MVDYRSFDRCFMREEVFGRSAATADEGKFAAS